MAPLKLGVLGSGRGSNYRAIQERIAQGKLDAEVCLVIADNAQAPILELARGYGVKAAVIEPGSFRTRLHDHAEKELVQCLQAEGVELVVLAGFMRILKAPMLSAFPQRVVNIHPSLLPKFPGLESWKQALAAGENVTGCTVHYVDDGIDSGALIAQRQVPVMERDTPESLHARIQEAEHQLYPDVLAGFAARHRRGAMAAPRFGW